MAVPWSTGFEDRFCGYTELTGFCYPHGSPNRFSIVTSPVHSGRYAAAFSVNADDPQAQQTRCVRQGALPMEAYYTAWYYVPAAATTKGNWNLWYFQGGADVSTLNNLWNVTLLSGSNGELQLIVYTPLNGGKRYPLNPTIPIPIGSWFQIQFFLKRAADATGEVALYQDGVQLFDVPKLVTDDSSFGQWYVGNLADDLTPADSTLYVDDVSISATR